MRTYAAQRLLLCTGAWIGDLVPAMRDLVAVYRQLLFWFPIRKRYRELRDMPTFVRDVGEVREGFVHLDGFYGFPAIDGPGGGVKVAAESYEHTAAPDSLQHPATPAEAEQMYERYVAPYLPWLGAEPLRTVSCLYTSTLGSRFVIDRHPDHDPVSSSPRAQATASSTRPRSVRRSRSGPGHEPDVDLAVQLRAHPDNEGVVTAVLATGTGRRTPRSQVPGRRRGRNREPAGCRGELPRLRACPAGVRESLSRCEGGDSVLAATAQWRRA